MLALLSFSSTFISCRRFLGKILIVYVSSGAIFSYTRKIESLLAFLSFTPSCNAVRYLVMNDVLITTCALLISGDFLTPTLYIGYVLLYACVSVSACSYASLAILCQGIKQRTVHMQGPYVPWCGTFASPYFQSETPPGFFPFHTSPCPLQCYYGYWIPDTPRTRSSTTRATKAGGLFTRLPQEAQDIVVTFMEQLLEENKRAARPRLSILRNLVAMTNSQIDFIINLYSMARTGKLGSYIAECASTTFTVDTQLPLHSEVSHEATEKQCSTRRTENAATCPRDYETWKTWRRA